MLLCFCGQRKKGTIGSAFVFSLCETKRFAGTSYRKKKEEREEILRKNDHFLFRGPNAGFVVDL